MIPNNYQNFNKISSKIPQLTQQRPIHIPPGKHLQQCGGSSFIIYDYYETIKIIGHGSFGIVAQVLDKRTNQHVAIKKVKHAFRDLVDSKRVLREIKLLMFLQHPNIIGLIDIIKPDSEEFDEVYLVFEYMQSDLEKVINSDQKLYDKHIKYFLTQILLGIYYLHSADVIHRDLKPSNLFVNRNCQLRVGDLNLARKFENINYITEYVVTRWYRAPEILLSQAEYSKAIDVWSIGCIFAELMTKTPLFKGEHYLNQIECIVAILGTPTESDFNYQVQEKSMGFIKSLPKREPVPFKDLFPNANPLAIDLLSKMLIYNPKKRFTIQQCLQHEYIKCDPQKMQVCDKVFDWSFDNIPLEKKQIQKVMYEASLKFYKEEDHPNPNDVKQQNGNNIYNLQQKQQQQFINPQQILINKIKQQHEKGQEQTIQTSQDIRIQQQRQLLMKNKLQDKNQKKQENISFKQQMQQMRMQQQQQEELKKQNENQAEKIDQENDQKPKNIPQQIIITNTNSSNQNDSQQQETPTLNNKLLQKHLEKQQNQDSFQKQLEQSKQQLSSQSILPVEKHISFSDKIMGQQNTPLSNKKEKSDQETKTEKPLENQTSDTLISEQNIKLKRNFSFADKYPSEAEDEKQQSQKKLSENDNKEKENNDNNQKQEQEKEQENKINS